MKIKFFLKIISEIKGMECKQKGLKDYNTVWLRVGAIKNVKYGGRGECSERGYIYANIKRISSLH